MECINYKISETIPPEFAKITLASATFYKLVNILNQLEGEESVKKHTIISTTLGHLIELHGEKVLRSTKLISKDVTKIVIHHEFHPLQLYIVLLCSTHKAVILSYNDFKTLHEWEDICDITSEDLEATGVPYLRLSQQTGEVMTISSKKLLTLSNSDDQQQEEMQKGKSDAVEALAQRLKSGFRHIEQLNSQRRMKEHFIAQKLLTLQSQLQGLDVSNENNLVVSLTVDEMKLESKSRISVPKLKETHMKILNVRHKIVHDKWIIGLNVVNDADRLLVCNPQLILQVVNGADILSYTNHILKVVQRRQTKSEDERDTSLVDTKVTIENLEPPILRPKKKVCIIGVCDIPSFNEGSTVICSGILVYTCKSLETEATQSLLPEASPPQYQISFEPVEILAHELKDYFITIEKIAIEGGVSFSTVALLAGSICNNLSITSLVSPLTEFISKVSENYNLVKVSGVSDLYCFYPVEYHPLGYAAFIYHPLDTHNVDLKLYTRDDRQALLVVHSLLEVLPKDANIKPPAVNIQDYHIQVEKLRHQLLAKMKEATTYATEGCEAQFKAYKKSKDIDIVSAEPVAGKSGESDVDLPTKGRPKIVRSTIQEAIQVNNEEYMNEREDVLARKGDVTFDAKLYCIWRKKLHEIQLEVDNLYIKYLE
ncbi:uncharacterized protein [Panulirus ornatus]|uniref:uncharacterized protein n=1 Tax=Panulirus ornatus TaxID=150431 RepID=UPI003A852B71